MKNLTQVLQQVVSRQITDIEEMTGNLVKVYSGQENCLILTFDDGRWGWFKAEENYEGRFNVSYPREDYPSLYDLLKANIITEEERQEHLELSRELDRQQREQKELEAYQRLKEKYG